ncbi:MAG: FAD-dependent oxidoreductase [Parafannyhessea umbonata]|nr:FAD-dependent oxidoreductase [Parafannyhessea umbonata]
MDDALIVAVGSSPLVPPIPGLDGDNVVVVNDYYKNVDRVSDDVVVSGGGLAGCERAAPRAAGPAWPRLTYNITLKVDVWAAFAQLAEMCRKNVLR